MPSMLDKVVFLDIEVSPNYFLVGMLTSTGHTLQIEARGRNIGLSSNDRKKLTSILHKYPIVTFNGIRYDLPVLSYVLKGVSCFDIYQFSKQLIESGEPHWIVTRKFDTLSLQHVRHVDLFEPSPAVGVGLKMYGARMNTKHLQDLPYDPHQTLTYNEMDKMAEYNLIDLTVTKELFNEIRSRLELREGLSNRYGIDLMSKSDAQIAEAIVIKELGRKLPYPEVPNFATYTSPDCVKFKRDDLNELLDFVNNHKFKINRGNGQPVLPEYLKKLIININNLNFNVGIGGLHSQEKSVTIIPKEDEVLRNVDVASYYPSMIIEFGFYPKSIGKKFLDIYKGFYDERMELKFKPKDQLSDADKTLIDGFKIVLNGLFGKLGSRYSKFYDPNLLLQITITGQLMLLMLIEQLTSIGCTVVSANTDGIEFIQPKEIEDQVNNILSDWEFETGMILEFNEYLGLYSRDVNNYVAHYPDKIKGKGVYSDQPDLKKNIETPIVYDAIKAYIQHGTDIETTINLCNDITRFISVKKVNGGGVWRGEYLGKVVRWYYSTDGESIHYKTNGNKVGKSDNAHPCMTLPDYIPVDLDRDWYIKDAYKNLKLLGLNT